MNNSALCDVGIHQPVVVGLLVPCDRVVICCVKPLADFMERYINELIICYYYIIIIMISMCLIVAMSFC